MSSESQPNDAAAPREEIGRSSDEVETSPQNLDASAPMQEDDPAQQDVSQGDAPVAMEEVQEPVLENESRAADNSDEGEPAAQPQEQGEAGGQAQGEVLACLSGMDEEVFNSLPVGMQCEVVEQNRVAAEVAGQLDSASGLNPEALAVLPEEMRWEVIEEDQRKQRAREWDQAPVIRRTPKR